MKSFFTSLFFVFLLKLFHAQVIKIKIHKSNGVVIEIPVSEIDSITHTILSSNYSSDSVFFNGYTYKTISIGSQIWFAENLKSACFANGDCMGGFEAYNPSALTTLLPGYSYNTFEFNGPTDGSNGYYYNGLAISDSRKVCPTNWHVPTKSEWDSLISYLGGPMIAHKKLKSTSGWSTSGWDNMDYQGAPFNCCDGTNESGFNAKPTQNFTITQFWSSTPSGSSDLNEKYIYGLGQNGHTEGVAGILTPFIYVRCIKD